MNATWTEIDIGKITVEKCVDSDSWVWSIVDCGTADVICDGYAPSKAEAIQVAKEARLEMVEFRNSF